jgi:hypothetical protein
VCNLNPSKTRSQKVRLKMPPICKALSNKQNNLWKMRFIFAFSSVRETLVELAAELGKTLPRFAPMLLEDVRDLCPALSTCKTGCVRCRTSRSREQNPGPNPEGCPQAAKPRPDDDGSEGACAGPSCSSGTSEAALQEIAGSNPTGGSTTLYSISLLLDVQCGTHSRGKCGKVGAVLFPVSREAIIWPHTWYKHIAL